MAEEPRFRRIKIKFGNTVVASQAVRISGLASSASADSKDAKTGTLALARRRRAILQGYVPPNASPDTIIARLREGEGFAPGAELPAWDFKAPQAKNCQERPAKRPKVVGAVADACTEPCSATGASEQPAPGVRSKGTATRAGRAEPTPDAKPPANAPAREEPDDRAAPAARGAGESHPDQAATKQPNLPLSPDDGGCAAGRAAAAPGPRPPASSAGQSTTLGSSLLLPPCLGQSSRTSAAPTPAASVSVAGSAPPGPSGLLLRRSSPRAVPESCSPAPTPAPRDDLPSTSGRPPLPAPQPLAPPRAASGVSVETQTTQRDFPILPTTFLELPRLSGTALSYQSIGPFDLQLEREQAQAPAEVRVDGMLEDAKRLKKEGDAMCHRNNRVWTIRSLSKYVSSALRFMEAADVIMRDRHRHSSSHAARAALLYSQTATLLNCTATFTDTLKGNGVGKEALRLLAERLCAVCLLRQTALQAGNFRVVAERAQLALREHSRQQAAQAAGANAAAAAAGTGQQPSPDDSGTSALHGAHAGAGTNAGAAAPHGSGGGAGNNGGASGSPVPLPGFPHERVAELLQYAHTTARFTEVLKRSCKSFEAFVERPDVRQDQQAKLVCTHLAAVCMDMGMAGGMRIIHHAREAVRTLCDDLAR